MKLEIVDVSGGCGNDDCIEVNDLDPVTVRVTYDLGREVPIEQQPTCLGDGGDTRVVSEAAWRARGGVPSTCTHGLQLVLRL